MVVMPEANLHLTAARFEGRRSPRHIERLIEGLRRAGLPEWPQGFVGDEGLRLDEEMLTALVAAGDWQGLAGDGANYVQRGATLCRSTTDGLSLRPLCGPVYRAAPDQSSGEEFVFVAADAVRAFSLAK